VLCKFLSAALLVTAIPCLAETAKPKPKPKSKPKSEAKTPSPEGALAPPPPSPLVPSFYTITPYVLPDGAKLEASGLAPMPDGRLAVCARKGEVWILEHPEADPSNPSAVGYKLFASGLHEPLGLLWHGDALLVTQRTEVTQLRDTDADGVADEYLTIAKGWGVSGAYHEYAYGPVADHDGNLWITLNSSMGSPVKMPSFRPKGNPWRGWAMMITPDGELKPMCAGFRSPCGLGANAEGDVFCTDQQGNWMPTNPMWHVRKGAFFGHADAVPDTARPESPVANPGKLPQEITVVEAQKQVKGYVPPAVWFPYVKAGQSPTGMACDLTGGKFGQFDKQMFVGEFVLSGVNRVFLEKVGGEYQGAVFKFVDGLQCAALSLAFLHDGSLLVGESNRGWNSQGSRSFGLERIRWTGKTPFEIAKMEAVRDGFLITFTEKPDAAAVVNTANYTMSSYTYLYHSKYGSDEVDTKPVAITGAQIEKNGTAVRLKCEGLRQGYVHELKIGSLKSASGSDLAHAEAYYTLNKLAEQP
jgi:glucose/arabinose dehydrogenase